MRKTLVALIAATSLAGGAIAMAQGSAAGKTPQAPAAAKKTKASPKDRMPPAIRAAFDAAYPNATVRGVSSEKENGAIVWEVESTDNGRSRDLIYKPDGTVVLIEEGIDEADLPQPVKLAVTAKYPKGKIVRPERTTEGSAVFYEMLVDVAGKQHAIELDPDGKPHVAKKTTK